MRGGGGFNLIVGGTMAEGRKWMDKTTWCGAAASQPASKQQGSRSTSSCKKNTA
jgi:hypothetical protein